ncbi:guanine nucleotide exchange factor [Anaeramoeba flamelloides]|uniref:Guanine nucleotide exchange factor n=1 Tax=Anaeramoeba flamelloides TaxID=1746091 RepID=A0ABQ8Y6Y3_9EUKA|nr:guanine nucleotide exchange factor [Anaeramoeba flamelloides]
MSGLSLNGEQVLGNKNQKQEQILDNSIKSLYSFFDSMFGLEQTEQKETNDQKGTNDQKVTNDQKETHKKLSEVDNKILTSLIGEGSFGTLVNQIQEHKKQEEEKQVEEIKKKRRETIRMRKEKRRKRRLSHQRRSALSQKEIEKDIKSILSEEETGDLANKNGKHKITKAISENDLRSFILKSDLSNKIITILNETPSEQTNNTKERLSQEQNDLQITNSRMEESQENEANHQTLIKQEHSTNKGKTGELQEIQSISKVKLETKTSQEKQGKQEGQQKCTKSERVKEESQENEANHQTQINQEHSTNKGKTEENQEIQESQVKQESQTSQETKGLQEETKTNEKMQENQESQENQKNQENQENQETQTKKETQINKKYLIGEKLKQSSVQEIKVSLKILEPLLIKEEKLEKGFQSMKSLYKNKRKTRMLAIDHLSQSVRSANMIRLFIYQLYRNLVTLEFGYNVEDEKYGVTTKDVKVKKPDYLLFEKWKIIEISQLKKSQKNRIIGRGEIKGVKGKFTSDNVYILKAEILDENYSIQNSKVKNPIPKIPKKINWKYLNIFEIDCEEVARQITIREFEVYQSIRPTELFKQSWNKRKLWEKAPMARYMIERFNQFSFWCCTMVLGAQKLEQRVSAIEYFVSLGEHLRRLNNFNCLMGVVSALRSNPLQRLKYTFEDIPITCEESLKDLDEFLNSENSFKNYRVALYEAYMEGKPVIPFLGIHLTDLTFLDDTSDDLDQNGEVNLEKMETMSKAIMNVLKYQTRPYKLKKVPQLQNYFKDYPALDGDALYDLSLQREPRGCQYQDLD